MHAEIEALGADCKDQPCAIKRPDLGLLVQVQFIARGPSGKGRVSADMYQDEAKQWLYYYLLVDLDGGRGRISIVDPHQM